MSPQNPQSPGATASPSESAQPQQRPALFPPGVDRGVETTFVEPGKPVRDMMVARFAESASGEARPTLHPEPAEAAQQARLLAGGDGITGTWTSNVKVDGMWCIQQSRNAWMYVQNTWKKIFNGTDPAFTALVTLASQAHQTGHLVSFREEPDGMVHEIYLW